MRAGWCYAGAYGSGPSWATSKLGPGQATVVRSPLRHSPLALEDGTQVLIVNSATFSTVYTDPSVDHAAARYSEIEVESS